MIFSGRKMPKIGMRVYMKRKESQRAKKILLILKSDNVHKIPVVGLRGNL
jgi:hypothetical protein